jgi:hypothetical protein
MIISHKNYPYFLLLGLKNSVPAWLFATFKHPAETKLQLKKTKSGAITNRQANA